MEEPERPEEGDVGQVERARALEGRIMGALGPHATEFQTNGIEIGPDGPRLIFYKDGADLMEIVFYAVDDQRHIVFQRALRRTYRTVTKSFLVYDDDDDLVEAVLPKLRQMLGILSKLSIDRST